MQRFREIEHIKLNEQMKGRLAQLVQSICLTSRGSAVLNPSTPTFHNELISLWAFSSAGSEHLPYKQRVGGSNPSTPTHYQNDFIFGRLAQLVQSICLTSRGSAVRNRQRPPLLIAIMISMVAFFFFSQPTQKHLILPLLFREG